MTEAAAPPRWPGHKLALALAAVVLILWLAGMMIAMRAAALPPEATGKVLAVFGPTMDREAIFAALVAAGGRPVAPTWLTRVWVVAGEAPGFVARLEQAGALAAYRELPVGLQLAGCFALADAELSELFTLRP